MDMLNEASYGFQSPITEHHILHWIDWKYFDKLPRFPHYSALPFMFKDDQSYPIAIGWHSKWRTVYPHSLNFRMLRAITQNDVEEIDKILKHKSFDVDQVIDQKYGYNSLQYATMINQFAIAELLLLQGANINIQDKFGNTPILLAVEKKNHQMIHTLLKSGCDLLIKNKYGISVYDKTINNKAMTNFIQSFQGTPRRMPRFKIQLKIQALMKKPFWQELKKVRVYANMPEAHPFYKFTFNFAPYKTVEEIIQFNDYERQQQQAKTPLK